MTDGPVLAANTWRTNAHLIEDVVRLGHLRKGDRVLDPTFGRGIWWQNWMPDDLVTHDKYTLDGVDFRDLPYGNDEFDVVAYDPPYVCPGGRTTSTLGGAARGPVVENERGPLRRTREGSDFHDRYGLTDVPTTPAGVQQLINDGLTEAKRVVKPRGVILVKCQDYVSSGKLWNGTYLTQKHAIEELDLVQVDRLEHLGGVRPQPKRSRQVHARRNLSTLFVFRKRPSVGGKTRNP